MMIGPALQEKLDALEAFYQENKGRIEVLQAQGCCSLVFNAAGEVIFQSQYPDKMFLPDDELAELSRQHGGQVFPFSFSGHVD